MSLSRINTTARPMNAMRDLLPPITIPQPTPTLGNITGNAPQEVLERVGSLPVTPGSPISEMVESLPTGPAPIRPADPIYPQGTPTIPNIQTTRPGYVRSSPQSWYSRNKEWVIPVSVGIGVTALGYALSNRKKRRK